MAISGILNFKVKFRTPLSPFGAAIEMKILVLPAHPIGNFLKFNRFISNKWVSRNFDNLPNLQPQLFGL